MNKGTALVVMALAACAAFAEPPPPAGGRNAFVQQQAYNEMMRVSEQVDVLQTNIEGLSDRLNRIEGGKGEIGAMKNEIEALRAEIGSVRREMGRMRDDLMRDITRKVAEMLAAQAKTQPPPPPRLQPTVPQGPVREYKVVQGDTLSLIAQAFNTTVPKLRQLNNLKTDSLRIGQKLYVPKN